jgi:prepilin-type N-terminal cleavage/methylation domain-containing protein
MSTRATAHPGAHAEKKQGFTLIELSIVLVIIGLIVGGVLVGQDLIRAAEIRATVGQIEKYNATVNTFRSKYNGVPGDLSSANAVAFGFIARAGSLGRGDNNGLIDGINGASPTSQLFTQESGFFWDDLTRANLVDGQFTSAADANPVAAIATANVGAQFPEARLSRGNRVHVGSTGGLNYYMIAGITDVTVTTGAMTLTANLTPTELFNMDNKLDDGVPLTGIVQAHGTAGSMTVPLTAPPSFAGTATVGTCLLGTGSATDTYNRSITLGGATPACIGRFRFN